MRAHERPLSERISNGCFWPRVCKNAMRQARRKNNDIFFFNVNETNFATLIGYLIDVEVGK
jgi:hypothetical protein